LRPINESRTCRNDNLSLKFHLQETSFKDNIKQIEEQELSSKVDVQKTKSKEKIEHVEEGSTSKIQIETID
jgi:hypothetical protein